MPIKILDRLEEIFIALLMASATLITFIAVVHRYLASSDLPIESVQDWLVQLDLSWAQELTIILFVWMAKFGAAYGVRTGIHVGVDVLINRLGDQKRRFFILFGLFAGALFTAAIGTLGAHFVWGNGAHYAWLSWQGLDIGDVPEGPVTPDLEWPTWVVYLAIPLGSFLMCFRFLQVAWHFYGSGDLPHHDHGFVLGNTDGSNDDMHPKDMKGAK